MGKRIVAHVLGRIWRGKKRTDQQPKSSRLAALARWIAIFLVVAGVGCLAAHQYEFSVGERSGRLIKLSHEGVLFKTWEGQLKLSASSTDTWAFSIPDPELARELQERMGRDVTLHYSKRLVGQAWVGETSYLVDGVR